MTQIKNRPGQMPEAAKVQGGGVSEDTPRGAAKGGNTGPRTQ